MVILYNSALFIFDTMYYSMEFCTQVISHFEKHLAFTQSISIDCFMIKSHIHNNTIEIPGKIWHFIDKSLVLIAFLSYKNFIYAIL